MRKLFSFASAVSIVLFGAVLTFLALPYRHSIAISNIPLIARNATATIVLHPEHSMVRLFVPLREPNPFPKKADALTQLKWWSSVGSGTRYSMAGLDLVRGSPQYDFSSGRIIAMTGYRSDLTMRFWHLLIVFSILPLSTAITSWSLRRRYDRRSKASLCIRCGYDLRASTLRCPECGEEVETQKPGIAKI